MMPSFKQRYNKKDLSVSVDSEWLTFINDIDGTVQDGSFWSAYLNDEQMMTGLTSYLPEEGDRLHLKMETMANTETGDEQAAGEVPVNIEDMAEELIEYIKANHITDWYSVIALQAFGEKIPAD